MIVPAQKQLMGCQKLSELTFVKLRNLVKTGRFGEERSCLVCGRRVLWHFKLPAYQLSMRKPQHKDFKSTILNMHKELKETMEMERKELGQQCLNK